jgi:hypothetical protein
MFFILKKKCQKTNFKKEQRNNSIAKHAFLYRFEKRRRKKRRRNIFPPPNLTTQKY